MKNSMIYPLIVFQFIAFSCGTQKSASVKMNMVNTTPSVNMDMMSPLVRMQEVFAETSFAPTLYQLKILDLYLVPNINADLSNDVEGGAFPYIYSSCGGSDCGLTDSTLFVDLVNRNAPASSGLAGGVNTILSNGGTPISVTPGTYRFARMDLCSPADVSESIPNVNFQASGQASPYAYHYGECTVNSTDPSGGTTYPSTAAGIQINPGDTVTVTLTYDLTNLVTSGSGQDCSADGYCAAMPAFTLSFSKD